MKELRFSYRMLLRFSEPVCQHRFTLRCTPLSGERQQIRGRRISVYPNEFTAEDMDAFGNRCIYGYAEGAHNHFSFSVSSTAYTGLQPYENAPSEVGAGAFKYQTAITRPGEALRSFSAQQKRLPDEGGLAFAVRLMHTLYGCMRYTPDVTTVQTTAEQAFAAGAGVCQDYAHILLSLCRIEHIPCRFGVGLLLGEGASHAWTEIWDSGRWYALDPTNDLIVDDQHIKISSGRDYQDCIINQGLFIGQARQEQQVCASVLEQQ